MANQTARRAANKVLKTQGGPVAGLNPRERAAAAQPTAAKAQAVYNGPKFDNIGRQAPRKLAPTHGQFQPTVQARPHVDVGAQVIASKARK